MPSLLILAAAIGFASATARAGITRYVDDDAAPGGDGTGWATAYDDLQDALTEAEGDPMIQTILVGHGTYVPTLEDVPGDPRSMTFRLVDGVAMVGGFAGIGAPDPNEHDPAVYVTVLNGDRNGDDLPDFGNNADNVYHVMTAIFTGAGTRVEGFTIRGGNASGTGLGDPRGGALYGEASELELANCVITDNVAAGDGGGVYIFSAAPTITGCTFRQNAAGNRGGGAFPDQATVVDCLFEDNSAAADGGGVFSDSDGFVISDCVFICNVANRGGGLSSNQDIVIERCEFAGNLSTTRGGAVYLYGTAGATTHTLDCLFLDNHAGEGGAAWNDRNGASRVLGCVFLGNTGTFGAGLSEKGTSVIANCLFSGNAAAGPGGGLRKYGQVGTVVNCTFSGNSATNQSGGIAAVSTLTVANTILWGNDLNGGQDEAGQIASTAALDVDYCCIQGLTGALGGTGNTGADPLFVDPLGPDATAGTEDDDLRVDLLSPCVDAADNDAVPADELDLDDDLDTSEPLPIDLGGGDRFQDAPSVPDSGNGAPPVVDMGAYERFETLPPGAYVGPPGGSWFDPANWAGNAVPGSITAVFLTGAVVVDGPGAQAGAITVESTGSLEIAAGDLTAASMLVRSGGTLALTDAAAHLSVADLTTLTGATVQWTAGTVRILAGGTWDSVSGPVTVGCAGPAELITEAGASVIAAEVQICAAGTASGAGTLAADVSNGGTVAPGLSAGILVVDGTYTQSATGVLEVEMEGYVPGSGYDQLQVTGVATLAGTLDVTLLPAFEPSLGGDQRPVTALSIDGVFSVENLPGLPGEFVFDLGYGVLAPSGTDSTVRLRTSLLFTGPRLFVDRDAARGGDGQSWATATRQLQGALQIVNLLRGTVADVWVAAGTYTPDHGTGDRYATFRLFDDVAVYGGFAGGERTLEERDVAANVCTLSGDLAGDDGPGFANNDENSYHVVTAIGLDGAPVLDGFTVSGGNADKPDDPAHSQGGGMNNGAVEATVANCRFADNFASQRGGGLFDSGTNTVVTNCDFQGNGTLGRGGGYVGQGNGIPTLSGCDFEANEANIGGGVFITNGADPVLTQCTFTGNEAGRGGGMYIAETAPLSDVTLDTCDFTGNVTASSGGAVYVENDCTLDATDCTFTGNSEGAIQSAGGVVTLIGGVFDMNLVRGAIVSVGSPAGVSLVADGTMFTGNVTVADGGGVRVDRGGAEFTGCTFSGNSAADAGGGLFAEPGAAVTFDGGTFSGNSASAGSGIYSRGGEVNGNVTMTGGDELFNGGQVRPGFAGPPISPGLIVVDGVYRQAQPAGTLLSPQLHIDLGGTVQGVDYGAIDAGSGQIVLESGSLIVELFDGFEPLIGQQFEVLSGSAVTGTFNVALMPGLPVGEYLAVQHQAGGISVSVEQLAAVLAFDAPQLSVLDGTPTDAALGDLDGDGDLDLVLAVPADPDPGHVAVFFNPGVDGKGDWPGFTAPPVLTTVGYAPRSLVLARLNGDAALDVAVANAGSHNVSVLFNDGSGGLVLDQSYPVDSFTVSVAAGTDPRSNAVDLVAAALGNELVLHFENDGAGGFSEGQEFTSFRDPADARLVDLDLDGDDDLVIGRVQPLPNPSYIEVFLYDEVAGAFGPSTPYLDLPTGMTSLEITQLDDDEALDVVAVAAFPGTITILVNEGDGSGALDAPIPIQIGTELRSLAISDLDLDADRDLLAVVINEMGEPATRVIRNDQNGGAQLTLATAIDLGTGGEAALVVAGDVNEDGVPDVLAVNGDGDGVGAGVAGPASPSLGVLLNATVLPACPADTNGSGAVDVDDLVNVIVAWGSADATADVNADGIVDVNDLVEVILAWGPCD